MKQRKILFGLFLGILFLFCSAYNAYGQEEEIDYNLEYKKECSVKHCMVTIPTLRKPENDEYFSSEDIYLTGLTPNKTRISIYVDGVYEGEAVVNEDASGTANFYFKVNKNIEIGSHKWSVISWTMNKWGRSFVSVENTFIIKTKEQNIIRSSESINQEISTKKEATTTSTESNLTEENSDISSIKEEKVSGIKISMQDNDKSVVVSESGIDDVSVSVNKIEENMLVVDKSKSEEVNKNSEITKEAENIVTEEVSVEDLQNEKQSRNGIFEEIYKKNKNKIIGIGLLSVVVIVSILSLLFTKKK